MGTQWRRVVRALVTYLFSHVGLCVLVGGYAVAGALIFTAIEVDHRPPIRDERLQYARDKLISRTWKVTERFNILYRPNWTSEVQKAVMEFEEDLVKVLIETGLEPEEPQWSFPKALFYCVTVITTIGYGNTAPRTKWGKVVTMLYALLGIPMMLLCLGNLGNTLAQFFRLAYFQVVCLGCRQNKKPEATKEDDNEPTETKTIAVTLQNIEGHKKQRIPIYVIMIVVCGYVLGGALLFSVWEGWTLLDGAYFCFITLSTIGFGDLVPGNDLFDHTDGQAKLIICCIYLLMGLAIIAMSFNLVQEEVVIKCRSLAARMRLLKLPDPDPQSP